MKSKFVDFIKSFLILDTFLIGKTQDCPSAAHSILISPL